MLVTIWRYFYWDWPNGGCVAKKARRAKACLSVVTGTSSRNPRFACGWEWRRRFYWNLSNINAMRWPFAAPKFVRDIGQRKNRGAKNRERLQTTEEHSFYFRKPILRTMQCKRADISPVWFVTCESVPVNSDILIANYGVKQNQFTKPTSEPRASDSEESSETFDHAIRGWCCSITVANHRLITVIRFVAKSYTHS